MQISVPDGTFQAYIERPSFEPAPVVVVIQEIFGVNEDLRQTCREVADAGFIAIAPDLFWRDEPGLDLNAWSEEEWRRGLELYQRYDRNRGVEDIRATIAAARNIEGASGRVAVMGFCLGGLMTYLTAARTDVDVAVEYYGGSTEDYVGEVDAIKAPMLIHLAGADEFMPSEAQERIRSAVAAKDNIQVFTYDGCSHAFARHTGDHYDADAAKLANGRTFDFLREKLG